MLSQTAEQFRVLVDKLIDGAEKWRRAFLSQKLNKLFHKLLFVRRKRINEIGKVIRSHDRLQFAVYRGR